MDRTEEPDSTITPATINASTRMTLRSSSPAISQTPPSSHITLARPAPVSVASATRPSSHSARSGPSSHADRVTQSRQHPRDDRHHPSCARTGRRLGAIAGRCRCEAASVSAARPAASPSGLSRYRCWRGRPAGCSSSQRASTSPRSAQRISTGYRVPERSPCRSAPSKTSDVTTATRNRREEQTRARRPARRSATSGSTQKHPSWTGAARAPYPLNA